MKSYQEKCFEIYKWIAFVGLTLAVIFPRVAFHLVTFGNGVAVKMFVIFNFTVFVKDILYILRRVDVSFVWKTPKTRNPSRSSVGITTPKDEIEGIPIEDLVSFIFKRGSFKTKQFLDEFGVSTKIHTRLSKKLTEKGILERGEKNSLILSQKYNYNQCIELLHSPTLEKKTENTYKRNE